MNAEVFQTSDRRSICHQVASPETASSPNPVEGTADRSTMNATFQYAAAACAAAAWQPSARLKSSTFSQWPGFVIMWTTVDRASTQICSLRTNNRAVTSNRTCQPLRFRSATVSSTARYDAVCRAVELRGGRPLAQAGWLSDVNFFIKDDQSAPNSLANAVGAPPDTGATASSEGFSLTRDEAENMVRRAESVLKDIAAMVTKAERLRKVTPPAQDPASVAFNVQLVGSGQDVGAFGYGLGHLQREQGYLAELVQRLNEALGRTTTSDDKASTTLDHVTDNGVL
jgi:hypothetical protein